MANLRQQNGNGPIAAKSPVVASHPQNTAIAYWMKSVKGRNNPTVADLVTGSIYNWHTTKFTGASLTNDGQSWSANGTSSFLSFGSPSLSGNVTFAVTAYPLSVTASNYVLGAMIKGLWGSDATGDYKLYLAPSGGGSSGTCVWTWGIGSSTAIQDTANAAVNTVYRVVGTWNGTTMSLYKNGLLVASTAFSTAQTNNAHFYFVGGYPSSSSAVESGTYWDGYLDDAMIWSRSFSASDAWQDYVASKQGWPGRLNRYSPSVRVKKPGGGTPATATPLAISLPSYISSASATGSATVKPLAASLRLGISPGKATGVGTVSPLAVSLFLRNQPGNATGAAAAKPLASPLPIRNQPGSAIGSAIIKPLAASLPQRIQPGTVTGSVAPRPASLPSRIPPGTATGTAIVKPLAAQSALRIPPAKATGVATIKPFAVSLTSRVQPGSATGTAVIKPLSTTCPQRVPPGSVTIGIVASPRASALLARNQPGKATGASVVKPLTYSLVLRIPPGTASTGWTAKPLASVLPSRVPPGRVTIGVAAVPKSASLFARIPPGLATGGANAKPLTSKLPSGLQRVQFTGGGTTAHPLSGWALLGIQPGGVTVPPHIVPYPADRAGGAATNIAVATGMATSVVSAGGAVKSVSSIPGRNQS